ncbi:Kelch repeat-containing protein [Brumimicrobium oceani]|uniref:Secretion system C-terminal sorting domain-containing protein n=1 Tax=Brumimicrobium oceani TaxID=2100725 RepID=A0A2U2XDG9_9FLAO|nr:hypothetical protein [Brumimicrobium oceani]PWH85761.1 hypothetical protein DIT68_06620 [Brumimicrobium oceani]
MMRILILFSLCLFSFLGNSQGNWTWTKLSNLPISTSNNAVVHAKAADGKAVYSFGGISGTLSSSEIHQRVFKYDVSQDLWLEMDAIPDTSGKIASAASYVNDKIYIIGGYHVEANGTETSSEKVHIYNPITDVFEADGNPLPIPIDDHVQAVWRDSLIYVISGWSNTGNVPDVQIYNPELNSWTMGTPTPSFSFYPSFGASGYILGDTIFYFGGAKDFPSFEATNVLRKGIIDKNDPTQIQWTVINSGNGEPLYRAACSGHDKTIFWVGGAKKAYNFNALEYYNNKVVKPNKRIYEIDLEEKSQSNIYSVENRGMDLRGIAKLGGGNWIIAGGIDSLQQASKATYLLHNPRLSDIGTSNKPPMFKIRESEDYFTVETENVGKIIIYDIQGRTIYKSNKQLADLSIAKTELQRGMLIFTYEDDVNLPIVLKKIHP